MSLVLVGAPTPMLDGVRVDGMIAGKVDVEPGQPPPWIIPHCWSCRVPVERFTIDWIASPFHLPIQFQCHGKTGGLKVPYKDVIRASRKGGGQLWVFTETTNARR